LEDLFLGGQSSIILVNRRLSVKFLPDIQDLTDIEGPYNRLLTRMTIDRLF